MQTTREMPADPNSPEATDIALEDLSRAHETALPTAAPALPSSSASSCVYDTRRGRHDTGPATPNSEFARPGKSSVAHFFSRLARFWTTYVRCTVDFAASRDHLAVERTFLGYLRTSTALAMFGTLVAQLFTINPHDNGLGHSSLGKPLATVFFCLAILTVALGAFRAFRLQKYLIHGKALAGGFEPNTLGMVFLSLLLACFGITIAMDALPAFQKG